ncbi:unnamed protein product [Paramecium primaurelia]|uniref:HMG box domain-containing protein n=1 Tax=Paramecium primaurelia TaxID=5886 RepID=A0A8S1N113_PARPR|nr:unnamed protein product [Paramecium primaurelia]
MQLRSGTLKKPPARICMSSYQVFYAEKAAQMKKEGKMKGKEIQSKIREMWKQMDEEEKDKYEDDFEKMEAKYKEDLLLYYGGSAQDLKKYKALMEIPEKPKKPVSGCLVYIAENRRAYSEEKPDLSFGQVTKALVDQYNKLSNKDRKKYDDEFDKKLEHYHKQMEDWTKKYSEKREQFDQLIEEKFKRSATRQDLQYQELPPYKRGPRKMKDDDETAQQKPEKDEKQDQMKKDDKKKEEKDNKKGTKNAKDEGKGESKKMNEKDQKDKKDMNRKKSVGRKY